MQYGHFDNPSKEYAGNRNAINDLLKIQYVQYIAQMQVVDGIIDHGIDVNIPEMPDNFKEKDQGRQSFQAVVGVKIVGFDTGREAFLGSYRTYANPIRVEQVRCAGSIGYGDNPCGSVEAELLLNANETREFLVLVGVGWADQEGKRAVAEFKNLDRMKTENMASVRMV